MMLSTQRRDLVGTTRLFFAVADVVLIAGRRCGEQRLELTRSEGSTNLALIDKTREDE